MLARTIPAGTSVTQVETGFRISMTRSSTHLYDSVPAPLRGHCNHNDDRQPPSIGRRAYKVDPPRRLVECFKLETGLDIRDLAKDKRVLHISIGVVLCEQGMRTLFPTLFEEPSWRLGNEDGTQKQDWTEPLHQVGYLPAPAAAVGIIDHGECKPGGKDRSDVKCGLEERGAHVPKARMGQLGDEGTGCNLCITVS